MNTRAVICWIFASFLIASTSLAAGCLSDPSESEFNEEESDAGEPDAGEPDAGESDAGEPDAGDPDTGDTGHEDADTGPVFNPDDCIVPGENSLVEALEAGCGPEGKEIKLDADVTVDEQDTDGDPLEIDGQVIIEPHDAYDGDPPVIEAPVYGLFEVDGEDAKLELHSLDITVSDTGSAEAGNALITVTKGATLTTDDVRIRDIDPLVTTVLSVDDATQILLKATDIRDLGSVVDGPSAIDCLSTDITLTDGTAINANSADSSVIDNPTFLSAVALEECHLTVENSTISDNSFSVGSADAAAVDCYRSDITLRDGAEVSNNDVTATFDSLADDELSLRGAGFHLNDCNLLTENSAIDQNQLLLTAYDFDHDEANEFDIELLGAGVYAIDSDVNFNSNSSVSNNSVDVDLQNEDTTIELFLAISGSGIHSQDSMVSLQTSTVDGNRIDVDADGRISSSVSDDNFGIYSSGAGIGFFSHGQDVLTVEQSTISNNIIEHSESTSEQSSGFRSTSDTGAGISFSTTDDAQLWMANSTVMNNEINGGETARGAGVFVEAPSIPDFDDNGGFLGSIGDALADLFDWISDEDIPLTAVIRYSTIAKNDISAINSGGVGYHVDINPDADDEDIGPFISSIGLLLNENNNNTTNQVYDCDGTATTIAPDEDDDEVVEDDFNWLSELNVHDTHFDHQSECSDLLGGAGAATISLSIDESGETTVLLPQKERPPVDSGEEGSVCSGIKVGDEHALKEDQRGEQRPVGDGCDMGAVELQDSERSD